MRNILLTIAYDGTDFHGWQKQPGCETVQGHLEKTMSGLFKREIQLSGTSRTDAGVHAFGQRASFLTDINIPVERIPFVVNNGLAAAEGRKNGRGGFAKPAVRIVDAEEKSEDFHARFNSKGKKYIYRIIEGGEWKSLIFHRNYAYHLTDNLDIDRMRLAAEKLVGTKDFKSFEASGGNPRLSTVRTVHSLEVTEKDGEIIMEITGDGFLYNMVRIIAGTLVEVGQGKIDPREIESIVEACDRQKAGHTAPPGGLYLAEVYY